MLAGLPDPACLLLQFLDPSGEDGEQQPRASQAPVPDVLLSSSHTYRRRLLPVALVLGSANPTRPPTCVCVPHKLRMVFTFFND